jgi:hypothetical protein
MNTELQAAYNEALHTGDWTYYYQLIAEQTNH